MRPGSPFSILNFQGWNLSSPGSSCTVTCGLSLQCVASAQNAVNSAASFSYVASLFSVPCGGGGPQRGTSFYDASYSVFDNSVNACYYQASGISSCDASYPGDGVNFSPATRFCCCSLNPNDASNCPTQAGSNAGGGGTTNPNPQQNDPISTTEPDDDDCDGDIICTLLELGSLLFECIFGG